MSSDWCNAVHVTMTKILIVPRRRGRGKIYTNRYRVLVTHKILYYLFRICRLLQFLFFIALQLHILALLAHHLVLLTI